MSTLRTFAMQARPTIRAVLVVAAAASLAACETGSNALTGGAQPGTSLANNAAPTPPPQPQPPLTKVSIAPVIGAPDAVGRSLSQDMAGQIGKYKASVVAAGERADYTLRGYIVAAKDKANTKVSYIWDVTDPAGKRLNRMTGDEFIPGQTPKDPWAAVSPQIVAAIAQKSAAWFGGWLPSAQGAATATPIASAPAAVGAAPVQTASVGAGAAAAATNRPQTAAVQASAPAATGPLTAVVPSVTGAPGDGSTSLAQALQGELSKNGVNVGASATPSAYRVEGVVKMSSSQGGRQGIQIDWNVKDPQGKKLGTVSQKNEIPEGSLDGAWGSTAGAAAAAAAQGILKLLPR